MNNDNHQSLPVLFEVNISLVLLTVMQSLFSISPVLNLDYNVNALVKNDETVNTEAQNNSTINNAINSVDSSSFGISRSESSNINDIDNKNTNNNIHTQTSTQKVNPLNKTTIIDDLLDKDGTFFVSDAGRSHGGFEFAADYKTKFNVTNGEGIMKITLDTGIGDPLEKHVYSITNLKIFPQKIITMNIDNHPVKLVFVKNDTIWNGQFNNNYIASWGSDAPKEEIKGIISPSIFPGLVDFWYVELRINK